VNYAKETYSAPYDQNYGQSYQEERPYGSDDQSKATYVDDGYEEATISRPTASTVPVRPQTEQVCEAGQSLRVQYDKRCRQVAVEGDAR